jgi:hypothetical protein
MHVEDPWLTPWAKQQKQTRAAGAVMVSVSANTAALDPRSSGAGAGAAHLLCVLQCRLLRVGARIAHCARHERGLSSMQQHSREGGSEIMPCTECVISCARGIKGWADRCCCYQGIRRTAATRAGRIFLPAANCSPQSPHTGSCPAVLAACCPHPLVPATLLAARLCAGTHLGCAAPRQRLQTPACAFVQGPSKGVRGQARVQAVYGTCCVHSGPVCGSRVRALWSCLRPLHVHSAEAGPCLTCCSSCWRCSGSDRSAAHPCRQAGVRCVCGDHVT